MNWDELEPGQDDLVKDDSARRRLRKAARNLKHPGASDPGSESYNPKKTNPGVPGYQANPQPAKGKAGGGDLLSAIKAVWRELSNEASRWRDERRFRKD